MKSASYITSSKIEWIASLRGLAAFLVFVSHLNNISVNSQVLFIIGRMGVVAFFLNNRRIGFTFFLGAEIPAILFEKFFSFDSMNNLLVCLVKFILAFIFAELITWIFEKPVLLLGKKLEERI